MACCSEYQTNCLKVVTIGYLKSIIKDGSTYLIQNSSGSGVDVNLNALPAAKRDDSYCPTYSELTGGSLIPNWSTGSTPNGDTNGIYVNPTSTVGTGYAANQVVVQKDLQVKYTRFSSLSISATKTTGFSECGDSTTVSYTHKYVRYTKAMNDSCNIPSSPSSSEVSDTTCSELSWHTTYGSVSNCTTYTIPKNGSVSANSRTDSVYASVVFRGTTNNSNTLSMTQNALTGAYNTEVSGSYRKDRKSISCTYSPSGLKVYGTNSGENCYVNSTVSVVGTGTYDEYRTYAWKENNCDVVHWNITQERKVTADATESAGSDSYTFNYSTGCCDTSSTSTKTLSLTYGSNSCSATFTAVCNSCECSHCECDIYPADCVSSSEHDTSDKRVAAIYSSNDCEGSWSWQHVGGDYIFHDLEFRSDGYVWAANYANTGYTSRSETIQFTIGNCSKTITLCQDSATPPVSCREIVVDGNRGIITSEAQTEHDSSHIANNGLFIVKVWENADGFNEALLKNKDKLWDWIRDHKNESTNYPSSGWETNGYGKFDTDQHGPIKLSHLYIGGSGSEADGFWDATQCVVARLRYMAYHEYDGDHYPTCLNYDCPFGCYPSNARTRSDCSSVSECAGGIDYWYDNQDSLLSYAAYAISANNTSHDRLITVHWFRPGDTWDGCPSSLIAFLQRH